MRRYDLYGVVVESDYGFATPLPSAPAGAGRDLLLTVGGPGGDEVDWTTAEQLDVQGRRADGEPDFVFARFPSHDAVRITGALDFHVHDDRISCHVLDPRHEYLVDIAFLGMVMSFWLERRGVPTLHASVAVVDGGAVGFLGNKGGGKTSTLAACMQRGHPLLTDDLLALHRTAAGVAVERGFPALRLWPEQVERFVGPYEHLSVVHPDFAKRRVPVGPGGFGSFAAGAAPLKALYLPERPADAVDVEVVRLTDDEAVMALLRHSFLPREVQRFGWQPQRLAVFADVVRTVPVARLRYPSGFPRLPEVVAALERELTGLPG